MTLVTVPADRLERWVGGFGERHGDPALSVADGRLAGIAPDGSRFTAVLPFDRRYDEPTVSVAGFVEAAVPPDLWGVLLVRKGGFAVARLAGTTLAEHKIGQRHVQGRTKAGGQSQQRFARRRANQAREAYAAAAEHAARILGPVAMGKHPVATGGDRSAVEAVLSDPRLAGLRVVGAWLPVPDPRRRQLDDAIAAARSVTIEVHNAEGT